MGVGRVESVHGTDAGGSTVTGIRLMSDDQIELTEMPLMYGCLALLINDGKSRIPIYSGHPATEEYKNKLRRIIRDANRILNGGQID